ncbi:MAG: hypothetical protein Q9P14_01635 [candidate division KSB1 bacterium]|nr:hypothetical protein [candidate division KSB1 bacterium]
MKRNNLKFVQLWQEFSKTWLGKISKVRRGYAFHWVVFALTVLLIVLIYPSEKSYEFADLKEGEIYIGEQVVAPFTFSINKTPDEYNRDVDAAKKSVAPVFIRIDTVAQHKIVTLKRFFAGVDTVLKKELPDSVKATMLSENLKTLKINPTEDLLRFFLGHLRVQKAPAKAQKKVVGKAKLRMQSVPADTDTTTLALVDFQRMLSKIARDTYSIGILNIAPQDLPNQSEKLALTTGDEETIEDINIFHHVGNLNATILQKLREAFSYEPAVKAGYEILGQIVRPNIFYDENETQKRIQEAVARVPLAKGTVLEKEKIIDSHEKITKEHIQKLRSLAQAKAEREGHARMGCHPSPMGACHDGLRRARFHHAVSVLSAS